MLLAFSMCSDSILNGFWSHSQWVWKDSHAVLKWFSMDWFWNAFDQIPDWFWKRFRMDSRLPLNGKIPHWFRNYFVRFFWLDSSLILKCAWSGSPLILNWSRMDSPLFLWCVWSDYLLILTWFWYGFPVASARQITWNTQGEYCINPSSLISYWILFAF